MELLEVQKHALAAGKDKPGFAYYCQMGLGKTLTALAEFVELVQEKKVTRLVVVSPNSFKSGWQDEIKKHGINVRAHIFESGADWVNDMFLREQFDKPPVLIINYEAIRKPDTFEYIRKFVSGRDAMIVLDESIQIKSYNSQQTRAALALAQYFKYRRILSGKPVTGGPHDLWSQMKFIGAISDKFFPFKTTFCRMGGFKAKKVVGTQNEELLAAKIEKFIFRASKEEWTDLPPKIYTSRQYQLTPKIAAQYKSMEEDFVLWLSDTEVVTVEAFITKYVKLAQIQSGFIIKEDGKIEELVPPEENPRFLLVRELLEEIPGKVVVPYVHRYTSHLLLRSLEDYFPAIIKGGMSPEEIQFNKNRFNDDPECRVILGQMRATKYGFTLLGGKDIDDRCSAMIFAENSYSLDDRSQVEDRIHRHGQVAESCLYVDVWGTDLDRRVTAALQAKESIAQAVFSYFGKSKLLV
jgi:SWI/SNF-related matrix-associated actin-dependent regulator 1 of chromatin subfamily A